MFIKLVFINLVSIILSSNPHDILENIVKKIDTKKFKIHTNNQISSNMEEKIINGELVDPGTFPFMISLGFLSSDAYFHTCGGTIISTKYIITAAHCVDDLGDLYNFTTYFQQNKRVLVAISGTNSISGLSFLSLFNQSNINLVTSLKYNQNYTTTTDPNDIAILTISRLIDFSPLVYQVNLPKTNDPSVIYGKMVTTIGWGVTELGKISLQLLKARLTVLNRTPLENECGPYYIDHYCARDTNGMNANVCFGDSGGPLISFENDRWTFYGITSFVFVDQNRNCINTKPSFFSMVPRLLSWVHSQIQV